MFKQFLTLLATVCAVASAAAYESNAQGIVWKYYNGTPGGDSVANRSYTDRGDIPNGSMAGSAYYAQNFNTLAKPLTAPGTLKEMSSKISYTLQERRHIDKSSIVLNNDDQSNIKIEANKTAEVWVTFYNEGAGFDNSVGFFTYALNAPPVRNADGSNTLRSEQIFFPRSSTPTPLRAATTHGVTVYLGEFNGGSQGLGIGFFMVANAWSPKGRGKAPEVPGVKTEQHKNWVFYSLRGLNPECVGSSGNACTQNQHSILLNDAQVTGTDGVNYQRLVVGFEDSLRTDAACDHDFNDVLLAVHVTPGVAISNLAALPKLISNAAPDSDGDGVNDAADEYPKDPQRALSRYYPGSGSWGTLAFEDSWPVLGDYDLNDIVLRYRAREVLNAKRAVAALEMNLRLDARGGALKNGFAISLPGVSASNVASATLTRQGVAVTAPVLLTGVSGERDGAVFEIFTDATVLMPPDNTASCQTTGYRNTGRDCPIQEVVNFKLVVNFKTAVASFPAPPYDAFIFNSNGSASAKGVEIHLPGRQPTTRADRALLGTRDDRTLVAGVAGAVSYTSANGLPWGLDIPVEWDYPYEYLEVGSVYPNILPWALSRGATHKNWYELAAIYMPKTFRKGR